MQRRSRIKAGRVDLREGSVERLPFEDEIFDCALAVNSMQVWPNASAGVREIRRVIKAGGKLALAFTSYSGQSSQGVPDIVTAAGFADCRLVETDKAFCVLATR